MLTRLGSDVKRENCRVELFATHVVEKGGMVLHPKTRKTSTKETSFNADLPGKRLHTRSLISSFALL